MELTPFREFIDQAKDAGLQVALAGSIKFEHADMLFELDQPLIGVRGAVCEGRDRKTETCFGTSIRRLHVRDSGNSRHHGHGESRARR